MNATIVTCLAAAASLFASGASNPSWMADYGQALNSTKTTGRPLLIILEDPIEPAHRLSPARFRVDETQGELLQSYVLCRVDVRTQYGKAVADSFQVTEFPHTAIIDRTGSTILLRKSGHFETTDWVSTLLAYRNGVQPLNSTRTVARAQPQAEVCFT